MNYFYAHKHLNDVNLQWKIAMIAIAATLFLTTVYMWLDQSQKKGNTIISGWVALYLLVNLIGVMLGYNLHSKGFMMILFLAMSFGLIHLGIRLWQK